MTPSIFKLAIITATVAVAILFAVALVHPIRAGSSEQPPMTGHEQMPGTMQRHHEQMMQMGSRGPAEMGIGTPTMPGQDAFGAIQEIVRVLESDPKTDWSRVNLEALRQHLIDMNEVTLKAEVTPGAIDGGLEMAVAGNGRTLAAIQRMVPAHAQELNQMNGWSAKTEALADGVRLSVTSTDVKEVAHIRGLGFAGLLVSGSHHQRHHLAMAKNEMPHQR